MAKMQRRADKEWDIIKIGGGASGTGIALEAVTSGYKNLLPGQSDFAGGTSSRSTGIVHEEVRYLAQRDILLVLEALKEHGRMSLNASHLTSVRESVIPFYRLSDWIFQGLIEKLYLIVLVIFDSFVHKIQNSGWYERFYSGT